MAGESIHHLEVSLAVDAAGVRRGFQTAAQEARHFKLQLEKESYKAEKLVPKQFGPDPTAEFLKQRKQSEESFKTWYKGALEEEYKDWYQKEQKKQTQLQQFLINETNVRNAARFQQQPEAETLARAKENDDLESAIRQRYQILDQEAHREMRLNRARELDAKKVARDSHNDQLHELRRQESLRQQAIRDGGIQELNQRKAISEGVIRQIRRQEARARDARVRVTDQDLQRQQDQDIGDASRIINRNRTATELYTQALGRLDHIRHTINRTTGRALLTEKQYGREKTRLTIATIRQQQAQVQANHGMQRLGISAGQSAMAMGQASYAVEDFIQVMSMGGGLNMALMSSSNNLTMVARSLLPFGSALGAIAGIAIPVVLTGIGLLTKSLYGAKEETVSIAEKFRKLISTLSDLHDAQMRVIKQGFILEDIGDIKTTEETMRKLIVKERERVELAQRLVDTEEILKGLRDDAAVEAGQNVPLKMLIDDIESMNEKASKFFLPQLPASVIEADVKRITEAYNELQDALVGDDAAGILIAAKQYKEVLDDIVGWAPEIPGVITMSISGEATRHARDKVEELLEQKDALEAIKAEMGQEAKIKAEILEIEQQMTDLKKQQEILAKKEAEARGKAMEDALQQNQWRQEEVLFMMRATDEQKAQLELLKEIGGFLGEGGLADLGQNLGVNALAEEFLKAKAAQIEKDMLANIPGAAGGLEQNGGKAQAAAFKQMQKKPDQTLQKQLDELRAINQALGQLNDKQNIELVGVP